VRRARVKKQEKYLIFIQVRFIMNGSWNQLPESLGKVGNRRPGEFGIDLSRNYAWDEFYAHFSVGIDFAAD